MAFMIQIAGEILSRAKHLVKGELNLDIVQDGPQVPNMASLRTGDVLLKQGTWDNVMTGAVGVGQMALRPSSHRYVGASLLGHAVVYLENGRVAEAVGQGVLEGRLDTHSTAANLNYADYNFYCLRCHDAAVAAKIAETARSVIGRADYSKGGLATAAGGIDVSLFTGDPTEVTNRKLRQGERPAMFCSEFVAYCLNVATDQVLGPGRRYFKQNQAMVSPEDLYVGLRDHASWTYLGELHKGRR